MNYKNEIIKAISNFNMEEHNDDDVTDFFVEEICGNILGVMENEIEWQYEFAFGRITRAVVSFWKNDRIYLVDVKPTDYVEFELKG